MLTNEKHFKGTFGHKLLSKTFSVSLIKTVLKTEQ